MCGSITIPPHEQKRLCSELGTRYPGLRGRIGDVAEHITGLPFHGFARWETYQRIWRPREVGFNMLQITGFKEKGKFFSMPGTILLAHLDEGRGSEHFYTTRLVTQAAVPAVARVHHRMPKIDFRAA